MLNFIKNKIILFNYKNKINNLLNRGNIKQVQKKIFDQINRSNINVDLINWLITKAYHLELHEFNMEIYKKYNYLKIIKNSKYKFVVIAAIVLNNFELAKNIIDLDIHENHIDEYIYYELYKEICDTNIGTKSNIKLILDFWTYILPDDAYAFLLKFSQNIEKENNIRKAKNLSNRYITRIEKKFDFTMSPFTFHSKRKTFAYKTHSIVKIIEQFNLKMKYKYLYNILKGDDNVYNGHTAKSEMFYKLANKINPDSCIPILRIADFNRKVLCNTNALTYAIDLYEEALSMAYSKDDTDLIDIISEQIEQTRKELSMNTIIKLATNNNNDD